MLGGFICIIKFSCILYKLWNVLIYVVTWAQTNHTLNYWNSHVRSNNVSWPAKCCDIHFTKNWKASYQFCGFIVRFLYYGWGQLARLTRWWRYSWEDPTIFYDRVQGKLLHEVLPCRRALLRVLPYDEEGNSGGFWCCLIRTSWGTKASLTWVMKIKVRATSK